MSIYDDVYREARHDRLDNPEPDNDANDLDDPNAHPQAVHHAEQRQLIDLYDACQRAQGEERSYLCGAYERLFAKLEAECDPTPFDVGES